MKKVKWGKGTECNKNATPGRLVRNGFFWQMTLEQRPECSEGVKHANNWRISLIGKGNSMCKYPAVGAC